jgi:predicted phosphodiesterase
VRYAVITDIHSNLEALEAVLARIKKVKADKILCLGDIVGYNADPAACLERTRGISDVVVRGNHDKAVSGTMGIEYFNSYAAEAVRWTASHLGNDDLTYLRDLPQGPLGFSEDIVLCHGSPQDEDFYLITEESIEEAFRFLSYSTEAGRICFFGHTHQPLAIDNESNMLNTEGAVYLERDRSYLINPGSVGQPRDGDQRAAFGVYDDEDSVFTFFRVSYAVGETQQKILAAGLAPVLAQRLSLGK